MISKKSQALLFVFGLAGFILFSACKKNNSGKSNSSTASMNFIDSNIQIVSISASVSGRGAVITGTDPTKNITLALQLSKPFVVNDTLDMDSAGDNIMVTIPGRPDQWGAGFGWAPGNGKVTITSWDSVGHRLSGSFSGVLSAGVGYSDTLSGGKFDVEYTAE